MVISMGFYSREMESRSAPQSTKIGEETPSLPEQLIIEEILLRLPVKSLLKFRCVAKSWCSLIGSKRFIKAHFKNSIKTSRFAHHWIFYNSVENEFTQCCLPSLFDKPFSHPISQIADLGIDRSTLIIPAGCCNGLVCILVSWKRFILWNPTTKKFNNLPDLCNLNHFKREFIRSYGFGFDELTNDYKVFGSTQCTGNMVYSLSSNSWKRIVETDHVSPFNDGDMGMGMYVSGKLHWNSYEGEIVSFDLNRHVSGVVELPSYTKGDLHSMGVVGGCLSAHFVHPNGDLDVWLMKEYGMKESWDKVMTVPLCKYLETPTPVAIAPNGEVLLIHNSTAVIYNPISDVVRYPLVTVPYVDDDDDDDFNVVIYSVGVYIESLASVAPDAQ